MNPYIEQEEVFNDFHHGAIFVIRELLGAQLGPDLVASIEQHLYIHERPAADRLAGRTDVAVKERYAASGVQPGGAGTIQAPAFGTLPLAVDEQRVGYVEVRDRHSRRLVTTIELLSPSNKYAGGDRESYLQKRHEVLRTNVHLVEIDLLRGGPRLPLVGMPPCDYCVLVARGQERPKAGVWPVMLRDRLPPIPIPLREGEPDASLDLQAMLDLVYDRSNYAGRIYDGAPQPALRPADAEWAAQVLARR
jgi:hypothetical protein